MVATNLSGLTSGTDQVFTNTRSGTNTVTTLADNGAGSLRQAIAGSWNGDVIVFATNGNLTLTSGEIVITNSLTLTGPGATNLAISGNNASRVFNISSTNAVVTIADVTICNGKATNGSVGTSGGSGGNGGNGGNGGGIYNIGSLTLNRCILKNNAAGNGGNGGYGGLFGGKGGTGGNGGGIFNAGTLSVISSTLVSNSTGVGGNGGNGGFGFNLFGGGTGGTGGSGSGSYNAGTLSVISSTLVSNSTGAGGNGGPGGEGGTGGPGGTGGTGGNGGGVVNSAGAMSAVLHNSLAALNTVGSAGSGGSDGFGGANGSAGAAGSDPDLSGGFTSQGHNLVRQTGNSTGVVNGVNNDLVGTAAAPINPLLGPLTNNGGATFTLALLPGSPALDAGDDTLTGTDQRGFPRKSGQHVDIGAYELNTASLGYSAPSVTPAACTVSNAAPGLFSATFNFSVNPNGLNTTATIEYGVTTSYGASAPAVSAGYGTNAVATNVTVSGLAPGFTGHYRVTATSPAGITTGADQTFTTTAPGDLNGDGVVSADEVAAITQNYWAATTNRITGLTSLGQGQLAFGLTNTAGLSFTVLASTNLTDWQELTNAAPQMLFNDAAATNAPQRFYRLRWP